MSIFKAYDVRGIYGEELTCQTAYRIGFFLPQLLKTDKVLVGRDCRISSDALFEALVCGIMDAGADAYNLGHSTTPMVYYATAKYKFHASVQITASHNPKQYNGFKISATKARPVGYDNGLAELEHMVMNETVTVSCQKGRMHVLDIREEYIAFMKANCPDVSGIKIGVDCSNGMAALLIRDILGSNAIYENDALDGTFPAHEPNPLDEKNTRPMCRLVKEKGLDIGIVFDGDADRVVFIDETGSRVESDLIIPILAEPYLKKHAETILYDIRTSRAVPEFILAHGGKPYMWKVGHAFAKRKMRELDAAVGGELAGHYYMRDFFYCDSGILAALKVLESLSTEKLGKRIKAIRSYYNSGERNYRVNNKEKAISQLQMELTRYEDPDAIYDFDGIRLDFPHWWISIRQSNTEDYLRVVAEADNKDLLKAVIKQVDETVIQFQ
jgi:phosphomannomutase